MAENATEERKEGTAQEEWVGMPEFKMEKQRPFSKITVRFETEEHLAAVVGDVGPPEGAVQRHLGHQLAEPAVGAQPFQHQQPPSGHGHVAEPVAGFVAPLAPLGKRHVDHQDPVEIDYRVGQGDPPLQPPHGQVEFGVFALERFGPRLKAVDSSPDLRLLRGLGRALSVGVLDEVVKVRLVLPDFRVERKRG